MTYLSEVLADSPVSLWRLGEASGTTAADEKGINPGTYTLGPVAASGLLYQDVNGARSFDGVDDYVSVPDSDSLDVGDTFTVDALIKPTSVTLGSIVAKGFNSYQLRVNAGKLELMQDSVGLIVQSTLTLVANTTYHVAATKSNATVKLYVNGVDVTGAVTNRTLVNTAVAFFIGRHSTNGTEFFSGVIDEVAVYNYALSAARVTAHYNASLRAVVGTSRVLPYSMAGTVGTSRVLLYTLAIPPPIRGTKPPLGLSAEIRTPEGAGMTWDSHARAEERPRAISFSTRRGEGFGNASLILSRRVDREYRDLGLLDELILYGEDGSTAFEGRLASSPRSLSDTHTIAPQFVGWMAHARDRKATQIYVDRDVSAWVEMSFQRRAAFIASGTEVDAPEINGTAVVTAMAVGRGTAPQPQASEAWYDAGPTARIGRVYFSATPAAAVGFNVYETQWSAYLADNNTSPTASVSAANPSGPGSVSTNGAYRFAVFNLSRSNSNARKEIRWSDIAVYGDHGLRLIGANPPGVAASDVIVHAIAKWCPMLNAGGVKPTTTPIPHLVFNERTDPYDIMLEANKFHLYNLAVWERRTVHFAPPNLADYDWEVRLSDHGVGLQLQGDSTEEAVYNGIAVSFENVATAGSQNGTRDSATPDRYPGLRSLSPDNPANRHGYPRWAELELSSPSTLNGALYIGQAKLSELNSPRSPGSITVKGHIRDRAGNWQPVWRVRAGETVAITDHPNTRPRLIVETNYEHDSYTLTIGVDSLIPRVEAILDRLSAAQVAVGTLS